MKLALKIYKKLRELKRKEKEVKENIERLKLDSNKYLKEEEIKLKRRINTLKENVNKGEIDWRILSENRYMDQIKREYECEDERLKKNAYALDQREKELDQREQEINEMQQKLNDQILKLGIVQGSINE